MCCMCVIRTYARVLGAGRLPPPRPKGEKARLKCFRYQNYVPHRSGRWFKILENHDDVILIWSLTNLRIAMMIICEWTVFHVPHLILRCFKSTIYLGELKNDSKQ